MHFCSVTECNYKTLWPGNLRRHSAVHAKQQTGRNGCSLCRYKTARHNNVLRHQRLVHGGKGAVVRIQKPQKTDFQPKPVQKQNLHLSSERETDFEQERNLQYQLDLEQKLIFEENLRINQELELEKDAAFQNNNLESYLPLDEEREWELHTELAEDMVQELEWVEELVLEQCVDYDLPTPPNNNVIIWPTAAHCESSYYKRPASTNYRLSAVSTSLEP